MQPLLKLAQVQDLAGHTGHMKQVHDHHRLRDPFGGGTFVADESPSQLRHAVIRLHPRSRRASLSTTSTGIRFLSTDLEFPDGFRWSSTTTESMRTFQDQIKRRGVVQIDRRSDMRGQADRAVARGEAVRVLPGVVAAASLARDPQTLIRALSLWHRDVVLLGKAALVLLGMTAPGTTQPMDWRSIDEIEAFSPTRTLMRPRIRVHRWHMPHRFITVRGNIHLATPEVSVLVLAIQEEWEWAAEALRQRFVTPETCCEARKSLTGRYPISHVDTALADITLAARSIPELEIDRLLNSALPR